MEDLLKRAGFKKVFSDEVDPEYYFWCKKIKHPFLHKLEITICEHAITVWCVEPTNKVAGKTAGDGQACAIIYKEKSYTNLQAVMLWLTNKKI